MFWITPAYYVKEWACELPAQLTENQTLICDMYCRAVSAWTHPSDCHVHSWLNTRTLIKVESSRSIMSSYWKNTADDCAPRNTRWIVRETKEHVCRRSLHALKPCYELVLLLLVLLLKTRNWLQFLFVVKTLSHICQSEACHKHNS